MRSQAWPPTSRPDPFPAPRITAATPSIRAGDRDVRVVMAMSLPRVVVFAELLSADECVELIALARSRLARSETVETRPARAPSTRRARATACSSSRASFPVCARLEQRIATLLDWPLENGEGLQILRYGPGAEYLPHYDYFDPDEAGTPAILKRGGQRVGSTRLLPQHARSRRRDRVPRHRPRSRAGPGQRGLLQLRPPAPGDAHAARRRAGDAGEKWVATQWLREGKFE